MTPAINNNRKSHAIGWAGRASVLANRTARFTTAEVKGQASSFQVRKSAHGAEFVTTVVSTLVPTLLLAPLSCCTAPRTTPLPPSVPTPQLPSCSLRTSRALVWKCFLATLHRCTSGRTLREGLLQRRTLTGAPLWAHPPRVHLCECTLTSLRDSQLLHPCQERPCGCTLV